MTKAPTSPSKPSAHENAAQQLVTMLLRELLPVPLELGRDGIGAEKLGVLVRPGGNEVDAHSVDFLAGLDVREPLICRSTLLIARCGRVQHRKRRLHLLLRHVMHR